MKCCDACVRVLNNEERNELELEKIINVFKNLINKISPVIVVFSSTLSKFSSRFFAERLKSELCVFFNWSWINKKIPVQIPTVTEDSKIILFGDVNASFMTCFVLSVYNCPVYYVI
jgi:Fe-S oxidoreductase